MNTETLEEYVKRVHPKVSDEYTRVITPFYYEPNVRYNPITSGFGCGSEGSSKELVIINGTYHKDGDISMTLQDVNDPEHTYGVLLSEAYRKLKRVDESIKPLGLKIPNNKTVLYMKVNDKDYTINQYYSRAYNTKKLIGQVVISCKQSKPSIVYGSEKLPYFELYSSLGDGKWNLKHVYGHDSVGREEYNIKYNISVREFKQIVFNDPNIKFKCQLFGN